LNEKTAARGDEYSGAAGSDGEFEPVIVSSRPEGKTRAPSPLPDTAEG